MSRLVLIPQIHAFEHREACLKILHITVPYILQYNLILILGLDKQNGIMHFSYKILNILEHLRTRIFRAITKALEALSIWDFDCLSLLQSLATVLLKGESTCGGSNAKGTVLVSFKGLSLAVPGVGSRALPLICFPNPNSVIEIGKKNTVVVVFCFVFSVLGITPRASYVLRQVLHH